MRYRWLSLSLGVVMILASNGSALAAHWLKVDPKDPFSSDDGQFHMMDVAGIVQDPVTGMIVGRFSWGTPEAAAKGTLAPFLWVFDCKKNQVFFAGSTDWRSKPTDLSTPHMGGVTNTMARKLCALSGSWPEGKLPP